MQGYTFSCWQLIGIFEHKKANIQNLNIDRNAKLYLVLLKIAAIEFPLATSLLSIDKLTTSKYFFFKLCPTFLIKSFHTDAKCYGFKSIVFSPQFHQQWPLFWSSQKYQSPHWGFPQTALVSHLNLNHDNW